MLRIKLSTADAGPRGTTGDPATKSDLGPRHRVTNGLSKYGLLVGLVLVIALFGALEPERFLTPTNFQIILGSQAVLVVLTMALMLPLTAGDFDLSVAGNLTLSGMVVAVLNVNYDLPIVLSVIIALGVGVAVGFINGALVVFWGLDSFIATLGTQTILVGIVYWVSNGATIFGIDPALVDAVFRGRLMGIPMAFYYALVLCLVLWYFQQFTAMGRRLLFVGRGRRVSLLSGIRVGRLRWGALTMCGLLSSAAGVMYAGTTGGADPSSGTSFMLPAFAACFLGATAIKPGRFNAIGTFIAVYFLVTGISGLQIIGAQNYVQQLFYGISLILAVLLAKRRNRGEVQESGAIG